jgi:MYXO-CTERM domain-containing protein
MQLLPSILTRALGVPALFLVLSLPRAALAQSVSIGPVVGRSNPDGSPAAVRPSTMNPTAINFADCEHDISLDFQVDATPPQAGLRLQAWAGSSSDCTQLVSRSGVTQTCWQMNPAVTTPAGAVPVIGTSVWHVRAQDLVSGLSHESPQPTGLVHGTESACRPTAGLPGPVPLSFFLVWVDGAGNARGTAAKYDLVAALVAPSGPSQVGIQSGADGLSVTWSTANDANIAGYDVYCDPPVGPLDADAGGGCANSAIKPGVPAGTPALIDDKFVCAAVDATSGQAHVTGLPRNPSESVAVGTLDNYGNVGISNVLCTSVETSGAAQPVGTSGDAKLKGCTVSSTSNAAGAPGALAGLGAMAGLLALGARRRKR